jgi:hypothetical protein
MGFLSKISGLDALVQEIEEADNKKCKFCGKPLTLIGEPSMYSRLKLLGCEECHLVYYFSPEELKINKGKT